MAMKDIELRITSKTRDAIFNKLKNRLENKVCFDCPNRNPTWATPSYGAYICYECSSTHRGLGTHISFVRSTELDEWAIEDFAKMIVGGNYRAKNFFKTNGITEDMEGSDKYKNKVAERYRDDLNDILRKDPDFIDALKNDDLETILEYVDKYDKAPKQKEVQTTPTTAPKVLGAKKDTNKTIGGIKTVSSSMFDDFDKESSESVEEKEPERQFTSNRIGIQYNQPNKTDNTKNQPQKKVEKKKVDTHRHNIFDDDDNGKNTNDDNSDDRRDRFDYKPSYDRDEDRTSYGGGYKDSFDRKGRESERFSRYEEKKPKNNNINFDKNEFKGNKSISSAQLFGNDEESDEKFDKTRVNTYSNSNSVTSNQYFNRGEPSSPGNQSGFTDDFTQRLKDTAMSDINNLSDTLREGGQKMINLYKNFFGD